jgi:signal transduction histidine kinase
VYLGVALLFLSTVYVVVHSQLSPGQADRVLLWTGVVFIFVSAALLYLERRRSEERHRRLWEMEERQAQELAARVAERTAELEQSRAELEAFSYSVSHDLRAPLRAVEGFSQALLEDYGDRLDESGRDYAERLVLAAHNMDALIRDLLAYSRLSRTEMTLQPVDLGQVVAEVLNTMQAEIAEKKARVVVEPKLPAVVAHPTTLVQIVLNLLRNALKFVPPGEVPRVQVYASPAAGRFRLYVRDNGIGIDPRYHERIFLPFERLHGADRYPGTGIGLSIVRRGAERMGGRVGLRSTVGDGSRFWIELPGAESGA